MDRNDAKRVIKALTETTFVCGENFIETNNGYIITKKGDSRNDTGKSD